MDNKIKKYRFYGEDYDLVRRYLKIHQIPYRLLDNNTLEIENIYENKLKDITVGRFSIS